MLNLFLFVLFSLLPSWFGQVFNLFPLEWHQRTISHCCYDGTSQTRFQVCENFCPTQRMHFFPLYVISCKCTADNDTISSSFSMVFIVFRKNSHLLKIKKWKRKNRKYLFLNVFANISVIINIRKNCLYR